MGHDEVVFWELEYDAQKATTLQSVPDGLVTTSVCPQCKGKSKWKISIVRPGPSRSGTSTPSVSVTGGIPPDSYVVCACGFPHEKRPAESDETGCGAYWPILDP